MNAPISTSQSSLLIHRQCRWAFVCLLGCLFVALCSPSFGQGKGKDKDKGGGGGGGGGGNQQGLVIGDPLDNQPKKYHLTKDYSLDSDLTIAGPVIIVADGDFNVGNNDLTVQAGGSLVLYVEGDVKVSGNGGFNNTNRPETLQIWGTATKSQSITVNGNGALSAVVYAPNADITSNGGGNNGRILGAVVANTIRFNGSPGPFHFDESLLKMRTDFSRYRVEDYNLLNDGRQYVDGAKANPSYDAYLDDVFSAKD